MLQRSCIFWTSFKATNRKKGPKLEILPRPNDPMLVTTSTKGKDSRCGTLASQDVQHSTLSKLTKDCNH